MTDPHRFHPKYIYWELCNYCNLNCRQCFAKASPSNSDGIDKNVLMGKIREIARSVPKSAPIRFGGGEPLLYPALFEVIGECRQLGIPVSMTTNGTLLDDVTAARLKDAELQSLTISIDGTKEYHEHFRGEGAFELAQKGLRSALHAGIDASLAFTVTARNHKNLFDYVNYFHGTGVNRFYLFRYTSGPDPKGPSDLELNAGILLEVAREMERIKASYPDIALVYEKKGLLDFILSKDCSRVGCNFTNGTVTIQHDGTVVVCAAIQKSLGNIYHDESEAIWKRVTEEIDAMREPCWECRDCPFQAACNGGCKSSSYKKDGTYQHADHCCFRGLC